jgi:adenylate cyclase
MNRYLTEMTETILDSKGTLDKYIGDAIMAFWGAPVARPDHALTACKTALENQKKCKALSVVLEGEGFPPIRARIGLNSGAASVGNMGSKRRFSYTALGDDINLASRLEGANKHYGTYIMIAENTLAQAGDAVVTRELDLLKVKGKAKAVRVYELLGLKGEVDPETLKKAKAFEAAIALYRGRRFAEAIEGFARLSPDKAAKMYEERCRELLAAPPPEDWDGSFALTEK